MGIAGGIDPKYKDLNLKELQKLSQQQMNVPVDETKEVPGTYFTKTGILLKAL